MDHIPQGIQDHATGKDAYDDEQNEAKEKGKKEWRSNDGSSHGAT